MFEVNSNQIDSTLILWRHTTVSEMGKEQFSGICVIFLPIIWLVLNSCIISSVIRSRSNSVYLHKKVEGIFKRQAWKLSVKWRISFQRTRSERTKSRRQNIRIEPPLLRSLQAPCFYWTSSFEHCHDFQPRTPTSLQWRPIQTFLLVCILFCYFFPSNSIILIKL